MWKRKLSWTCGKRTQGVWRIVTGRTNGISGGEAEAKQWRALDDMSGELLLLVEVKVGVKTVSGARRALPEPCRKSIIRYKCGYVKRSTFDV